MSDELEKTIEELEAEVLAELEEASEKSLGKAKDLGLGSNNADEGISKAKTPAANVAGADKKEIRCKTTPKAIKCRGFGVRKVS